MTLVTESNYFEKPPTEVTIIFFCFICNLCFHYKDTFNNAVYKQISNVTTNKKNDVFLKTIFTFYTINMGKYNKSEFLSL